MIQWLKQSSVLLWISSKKTSVNRDYSAEISSVLIQIDTDGADIVEFVLECRGVLVFSQSSSDAVLIVAHESVSAVLRRRGSRLALSSPAGPVIKGCQVPGAAGQRGPSPPGHCIITQIYSTAFWSVASDFGVVLCRDVRYWQKITSQYFLGFYR